MTKLPEYTNQEWVTLLAKKDEQTWLELQAYLYRLTYNDLHRSSFVWQSTDDLEEFAKECTQIGLTRIYEKLAQYTGQGIFIGWCWIVVLNTVRDKIRSEQRRRRYVGPLEQIGPEHKELPDKTVDQDKKLIGSELQQQVDWCVDNKLTEKERRVFLALGYQEQTYEELSEELNTNRNNIDQTWSRARKKVRKFLEDLGYTLDDAR